MEGFSAFIASTLADRKGKPRLMRIVLAGHVCPVTAISFFQAHGVKCSTARCDESVFLSCLPQRVPEFQRKVGSGVDFIPKLANVRKSAQRHRYMPEICVL